ncbi:MAG: TetR/AcrR family transcriptional regulator [Mesorhizobium sp.]
MDIPVTDQIHNHVFDGLPPGPRRALAQAATVEFGRRGYHATTTRHIAEHAGMSPAGLYVHYPSKAELLFTISRIGHEAVLNDCQAAVENMTAPGDRLNAFVKTFTAWHAVNHNLARVLQYELRALDPEHYKTIAAIRQRTEAFAATVFTPLVSDQSKLHIHTLAILSLGIDVARWYTPGHSPEPDTLGDAYAELVRGLLR